MYVYVYMHGNIFIIYNKYIIYVIKNKNMMKNFN